MNEQSSKTIPIKFNLKSWQLHIFVSLFLLLSFNAAFWLEISTIVHPNNLPEYLFIFSIFLLSLLINNLLFNILCIKHSYKIIYPLVLIVSALSLYFIKQYNIIIDRDMIQNIVETNPAEATDFLNFTLFFYLITFGIIPSVIIHKLKVTFKPLKYESLLKIKIVFISILCIISLLYISYPAYASMARGNRHISHLIIPTNFIFAGVSYIKQQVRSANVPLERIAQDAKLNSVWNTHKNKTVLVLVIGETARADHFSINGYHKVTTPKLAKRDIINFTQTSSCGTSTAISLPCMFSNLNRKTFSKNIAKNRENLLDFLSTAGYSVQWRDNNTGCKGICKRVDFIDLTSINDSSHCQTGECFDEILIQGLTSQILNNPNNQVIVLHQKGSHGPAYYLRYPQAFKKFSPICASNELQKCTTKELNNTYDNTIYYTDYVVDKVIQTLIDLPSLYNSSLVYISDHGESLGENNIYLHGTPYFMAPDAQTHVPFFVWLSDQFKTDFSINTQCLRKKQGLPLSHDNLFHSVLGLMNVTTDHYKPSKDIFHSCSNSANPLKMVHNIQE